MRKVSVFGGSIRLGQLLKLANIVSDGSDVKSFLGSTDLLVNGVLESRRGRQLFLGDVVQIGDEKIIIVDRSAEV